jgi:acetyl-CoA carboxylase biotin carboxyl carrier protein
LDIKIIKQIIDLMKRSELTELEVEEGDFKLRACKNSTSTTPISYVHAAPLSQATPSPFPIAENAIAQEKPSDVVEKGICYVKSPMVGTFYSASSPDSKPFTIVGALINTDSVVCIIEAMKVMNEIQSDATGTVLKILVENGDAVEYGQNLFKVKTA